MDGSKEQMQGDFRPKARQADCHIRAVEPHSPRSNAAEAAIRELKRGAGRKMIRSGAPRQKIGCGITAWSWRSNTALDICLHESERNIEDDQDDTTLIETPTYDLMDEDREDQERQSRKVRFDDELLSLLLLRLRYRSVKSGRMAGWVKRRKRNPDGSDLGRANANPILDTRIYEVEFEDGVMAEYSANVIAENMWAQCDSQGNQHLLLKEIIDHRRQGGNGAPEGGHNDATRKLRKDTKGWKLCIVWKDGSLSWEPLSKKRPVSQPQMNPTPCRTLQLHHQQQLPPQRIVEEPFRLESVGQEAPKSTLPRITLPRHMLGDQPARRNSSLSMERP